MNIAVIILGVIQVIVCSIAFFFKKKKEYLICNLTYNAILIIQYLLQGYVTELIVVVIDIIRTLIFFMYAVKDKKPNIYLIVVLEVLFLIIGILTFKNWFSIFIIISSMLSTFAQWQSSMFALRIIMIIVSILLILNYAFTGLYTTIIAEAISFGSGLVSLIKYYVIDVKSNKTNSENVS